jgi:hypothetical protein
MTSGPHSPSHGCIDHAGARGIDPNAARRIVHGGALCQPDYPMLGRVIGSPTRLADEAAKRGTVDNGAAALGTHLEQLVFHAGPDTVQIDGDHVVEGARGFIGQIAHRTQDTGVVRDALIQVFTSPVKPPTQSDVRTQPAMMWNHR